MFDPLPSSEHLTIAPRQLAEIAVELGRLPAMAETAFLSVGARLGEARAILNRLDLEFEQLTTSVEGEDMAGAFARVKGALAEVGGLADHSTGARDVFGRLGILGGEVERRLIQMKKVTAEVRALGANAKIQASLVTGTGIDFTVFTTEIERLGQMADRTLNDFAARLGDLRRRINDATAEIADFECHAGAELRSIAARLEAVLTTVDEHQRRTVLAAEAVAARSMDVGSRIGAVIGALQINDICGQRIAHVAQALITLSEMDTGELTARLDARQRRALVATVCHLQADQLRETSADFARGVGAIIDDLAVLAIEAGEIRSRTDEAFSSDGGHGSSFIVELETGIAAARALLAEYAGARGRTARIVGEALTGLKVMVDHTRHLASIDADMRIMGLNATLKCGRLGVKGRALGVIAHELRSCSKRMEEHSRAMAAILDRGLDMATGLGDMAQGAQDSHLASLDVDLFSAFNSLHAMAITLGGTLEHLHTDSEAAVAVLGDTARSLTVGREMDAAIAPVIQRLQDLAVENECDRTAEAEIRSTIHALLAENYTMDSERVVHALLAENGEPPPVRGAGADALDNVFF